LSGPVIIGGGPAGTAAAIAIATAGRNVTLIERNAGPADKVCGDFLSTEAIGMIETLGVDLSMASTISAVRLAHGNRIATTRLPFTARGMSRRALDEALLRRAQASGATVLRGHRVGSIEPDHASLRLACGSLGRWVADTVFLATGKHELRGAGRPDRGTGVVGLKMYCELAASQVEALRHHVELTLFAGGYAGLQLVEADRAVLCMLLPATRLRAAGGQWSSLLDALTDECPHLRERLTGARGLLDRPLTIAGLPYGYVHAPDRRDPPGLFRLGDQAAVIASLTGDGVALALASGSLAARTWIAAGSSACYHRSLAAGLSPQMRVGSAIHRLCLAPGLQPWVAAACKLWPGAMRLAATATRARHLTSPASSGVG
jgi:flavin-dependent dehydrogenase